MKFSSAFIPTLREAPSDAEVISHKLLVRAGMMRKVSAGIYEYLPVGLRSLKKIEEIVRDELNKAGCQEVFLPHMVPSELWQESGRWAKYGPELLRIQDRHERAYCFGPTHEEVICDLVRGSVSSYKSFPINLYQIQTKFRDEIRPRFGLMRGREFLMKDGYSFHTSVEDLDREYKNMHDTYHRIFKRCGLDCRTVEADTGAIGGSSSHEVVVLADTGEDTIVCCASCDYAANLEKAQFHFDLAKINYTKSASKEIHTPGKKTIGDVSAFLKITPSQMIKTLVYKADDDFVAVCISGAREVNEIKLKRLLACDELRLASDSEILDLTGMSSGYLGPVGLHGNLKIIFDHSILLIEDAVIGANKEGYHVQHINATRDIGIKSSQDLSSVLPGDDCPKCIQGKLKLLRGIEVGHIFKLGTRYSKPMKVNYLDRDGKQQDVVMGTYGIGVSRCLAASVEQNHDDRGICWPKTIAPYHVHLMDLDKEDSVQLAVRNIYENLIKHGIEVLWDDREDRAGVKFNDADLIGLPLQIVVGKRGLAQGSIDYKIRKTGEKGSLPVSESLEKIIHILEHF